MSIIPKQITIPIPDLQRSALKSLLLNSSPDYQLSELLELVLARGLMTMLLGKELPEVKRQAIERGEESVPERVSDSRAPRVAEDYLGFPIDTGQQRKLDDLLRAHPHLSEEEVCRLLMDLGLRAVQDDPFAHKLLANTKPERFPVDATT